MKRTFGKRDQLLSKQAYPPLYYLWLKVMTKDYAHPALFGRMRSFLEDFHVRRATNLQRPEDQRDSTLIEFGRLMQQGTNDLNSLQQRVSILRRYFLEQFSDVLIKDKTRSFTEEERLVIWVLGGKRCAECGRALGELEDMEADHKVQWAHGGATTLENGRSLCKPCNASLAQKVA
jgi:5-methylcytosine-specific restriction endonuclease McrA